MTEGNGSETPGESDGARPATPTGAFGPNTWLVEDMYDSYRADPTSVSESWREFFADYRPAVPPVSSAPAAAPAPAATTTTTAAPPAPSAPVAVPVAKAPTAAPSTTNGAVPAEKATPLRGAAGRIVTNMQASLEVPTATSVRVVPAKLLEVNRTIINNQLFRTIGGKVSFTH
ncbi:MAG TPA: hypothetical protein VG205_10160, partial [Acidimicrobiales bacterium]|nr:hypothetical protein [Acidimicrobiales bacterium]